MTDGDKIAAALLVLAARPPINFDDTTKALAEIADLYRRVLAAVDGGKAGH